MRTLRLGLVVAAAALTAVSLTLWSNQTQADQKPKAKVTRYEVDGTWPKPFPTTPDPTTGRREDLDPRRGRRHVRRFARQRLHRHARQPARRRGRKRHRRRRR